MSFGIFPSRLNKKRDITKARLQFEKWLNQNPSAKTEGVTFEDYLEIKEAQIRAVIMEIRIISLIAASALVLTMKGDDGKPLYYSNKVTRTLFKIFTKTGSELTFMWNPTETERLIKNPFPTTRLLTLFKNTMKNTIDESRDVVFGENSPQDKAPVFYYSSQWIYGVPQLTRFFEVFENQKKTPYQVFQTQ
jgi:hypothetical protein